MPTSCPELMMKYHAWKDAVATLRQAADTLMREGTPDAHEAVRTAQQNITHLQQEYLTYAYEPVTFEEHALPRIEAEAGTRIRGLIGKDVRFGFEHEHISWIGFSTIQPTPELNKALAMMVVLKKCGLDLESLTSAEGLILPQSIGGYLNLGDLTSAEGLTLPHSIGGGLFLDNLTSAEGLILPHTIDGGLNLENLTSAEGLTLPRTIGGYLSLDNLTSAEGLILPHTIDGGLNLENLTSAEGLTLPHSIGGFLDLGSLTSAEGLILPHTIGGDLYLDRLTSAEGLTLPHSIGGSLYLSKLTSTERDTLRAKYPHITIKPTP
ncbi:hypothetical protein IPJ70_01120 [Candidatus Campbellbacteria bacterium]|nr:MAG: hypothetical protein IPJ70_01120 [Candidatus Campbellbacteria bacterium]